MDGRNAQEIQRQITMKVTDENIRLISDRFPKYSREWNQCARLIELVDLNGNMPDQSKDYYKGLGRCWGWKGSQAAGYATIKNGQRMVGAHRVVFSLRNGEIPKGMVIRHRCDNKICTNPDHLQIGTQAENMRDLAERGSKMGKQKPSKKAITNAYVMNQLLAKWESYITAIIQNDELWKAHGQFRTLREYADFVTFIRKAFVVIVGNGFPAELEADAQDVVNEMQREAMRKFSLGSIKDTNEKGMMLCYGDM